MKNRLVAIVLTVILVLNNGAALAHPTHGSTVPEVHTGKVAHHADADGTPAADKPIHYDNVAIPEIHIHPRHK